MKRLWVILLLAITLQACKKHSDPNPIPTPPHLTDTIILDTDHPTSTISPDFEGLSYEAWLLPRNPDYLNANNTVLVRMIKNLGSGVLRIGGNSSDETGWTGKARNGNPPPNTQPGKDSVSTTDIDHLAGFSQATGWKVIFGLNLGNNDIAASTDEAMYTSSKLGNNLLDLQIGNEPDYFKLGYRTSNYSVSNFETEWATNYTAIRKMLPQAPFAGPDVSDNLLWINTFATDNGDKVDLLDAHYYVDGPATDPSIDINTILDGDSDLPYYLQTLKTASSQHGQGYRITEVNSIWGGGKPGVSDTFGGTLWALDFMWAVAANDGQGVNFHGGVGLNYSPVNDINGSPKANAVYYAMLAFKYGAASGSKVIPVTNAVSRYNSSAYACIKDDHTCTVTIINKEQKKDIYYTVELGRTISTASVIRLTAPTILSKNNISLAGSSVGADGTFTPGQPEQYNVNKSSIVVKVPAGSAAIITLY